MEHSLLGFAYDQAMAGTVGGVVSLAFIRDLTPMKAWLAIFTGFACAAYLTSPVTRLFEAAVSKFLMPIKLTRDDALAAAFVLGLIGVYLVAGLIKLGERFGADPIDLFRRFKNGNGTGNP